MLEVKVSYNLFFNSVKIIIARNRKVNLRMMSFQRKLLGLNISVFNEWSIV